MAPRLIRSQETVPEKSRWRERAMMTFYITLAVIGGVVTYLYLGMMLSVGFRKVFG